MLRWKGSGSVDPGFERRDALALGMGPSLRWGDGEVPVMPAEAGIHAESGAGFHVMRGGWVYIMTNAPYGTLYVGVTANLPARVLQHKDGQGSAFCPNGA
jgi:hypothetical protein